MSAVTVGSQIFRLEVLLALSARLKQKARVFTRKTTLGKVIFGFNLLYSYNDNQLHDITFNRQLIYLVHVFKLKILIKNCIKSYFSEIQVTNLSIKNHNRKLETESNSHNIVIPTYQLVEEIRLLIK